MSESHKRIEEIRHFWNQSTLVIKQHYGAIPNDIVNAAMIDVSTLLSELSRKDEIIGTLSLTIGEYDKLVSREREEKEKYRNEAMNERIQTDHIVAEREELIIDNERLNQEREILIQYLKDRANESPYATKHKARSILQQIGI